MLVILKPAGIVVNRAESVKGWTVQDWMEENKLATGYRLTASSKNDEFLSRSGVVHRLDKETSGVLVLAKNPEAFEFLKKQFKDRVVKKEYIALVHGTVKPEAAEINAPIGRLPWNRTRFGVFPAGREAQTSYRVTARYSYEGQPFSLLSVQPVTGRTHQIRVHLQYIHHPIVGDPLYGGRKQGRDDRTWCARIFLHAGSIRITTPAGAPLHIEAPLPDDLSHILKDVLTKT